MRPVGQALLLESGEVPKTRGGFLVHVNVTMSQSGESERRTSGRDHTLTTRVHWSPGRSIHSLGVGMLRQQENTKFCKLQYSGPCGASTPMMLTRMDNPCHLGCGDVEGDGDRVIWSLKASFGEVQSLLCTLWEKTRSPGQVLLD